MEKRKKSRTPPPPRPVQAPKERSGPAAGLRREPRPEPVARQPATRGGGRGARLWLAGASAAVVAVVVAVVLATTLGGTDASAISDAGCSQETFPSQGRQHVDELEEGFEYNSFPPTSGPHDPQPAIWNIYDEPPGERHLLHSLEHGGIAVQYGDGVPDATVAAIRTWYEQSDRKGIIVAPLPALGDKVALTAWTKLSTCPGFDPKAADTFVELYRYKGPERLPLESMVPGAS